MGYDNDDDDDDGDGDDDDDDDDDHHHHHDDDALPCLALSCLVLCFLTEIMLTMWKNNE